MKNILCVIMLLSLVLNAQLIDSNTSIWYVKNGGNDSHPGSSPDSAWATMNHASTEINPGDILIIDGSGGAIDMYNDNITFPTTLDATQNQPTRIIGRNGAILTAGGTLSSGHVPMSINSDWIEFNSIKFDGQRGLPDNANATMWIRVEDHEVIGETRHIKFVNCEFVNNAGILQNEDNTGYVYNLTFSNCTWSNVRSCINLQTGNYRQDLGSKVTIENCTFNGPGIAASGSYVYLSESSSNSGLTIFRNNIASNFLDIFRTHATTWMNAGTPTSTQNRFNIYYNYGDLDDEATNITLHSSEAVLNPLFVDPANDDLNVQANSPAVGFGAFGQSVGAKKRSAIDASY